VSEKVYTRQENSWMKKYAVKSMTQPSVDLTTRHFLSCNA